MEFFLLIIFSLAFYFIFIHHLIFPNNISMSLSKKYVYTNHCWKCQSGINSEHNEKCDICGWYICSKCGSCKEGCNGTAKNKISHITTANLYYRDPEIQKNQIINEFKNLNIQYNEKNTINHNKKIIEVAKKLKMHKVSYDNDKSLRENETILSDIIKLAEFNQIKNNITCELAKQGIGSVIMQDSLNNIDDLETLNKLFLVIKKITIDIKTEDEITIFNNLIKISEFIQQKEFLDITEDIFLELNKYSLIKEVIKQKNTDINNKKSLINYFLDNPDILLRAKIVEQFLNENGYYKLEYESSRFITVINHKGLKYTYNGEYKSMKNGFVMIQKR